MTTASATSPPDTLHMGCGEPATFVWSCGHTSGTLVSSTAEGYPDPVSFTPIDSRAEMMEAQNGSDGNGI
jgi:hypothetical protein